MPRLASFHVLSGAVSNGTSNTAWSTETFAYAEAHDGSTWVGVRAGEHVSPSVSGRLIHPDFVPAAKDQESSDEKSDSGRGDAGGGGKGESGSGDGGGSESGGASGPARKQFYAQFDLDPVRGIKQLGEILEHVTARLGPGVKLHLEVRASSDDGYDDATQRIVKENAANLGAHGAEFEA
jgi:hypothetical protein